MDAIEYDITNYHPVFIHKGVEDDEWVFDELEEEQLIKALKARLKEREKK